MGKGASTIIPAKCGAKVSMRIVADQDPQRISDAFDQAIESAAPNGVRVSITTHGLAAPYVCPLDSPGMKAATTAVEAGFGVPPLLVREGGTLPILAEFKGILGADSLMMGFCLPNCNAHGPNEFLVLDDLWAGIRTAAHFIAQAADIAP
jgi:acetylornithine deacetylase/succinyl-diaminopimelate desuccinylase-like protein